METLLLILLLPMPDYLGRAFDPSPGLWQSKEEARSLECRRMSQAQAHELYPGQVPEPPPRGEFGATDALACSQRILSPSERKARDEALLATLRQSVGELTEQASATYPGELTWQVDAFYPDPVVASKVAVAARTDLAERGRKVSDRVPVLAAGDISVLAHLPAKQAYPLACRRYRAQHLLSEKDAFLGLMILDAREFQLHAGVCLAGEWKWLR